VERIHESFQNNACEIKSKRIQILIFSSLVFQIDVDRIETIFRDITNGTNELIVKQVLNLMYLLRSYI
jgi:hypothetical protein